MAKIIAIGSGKGGVGKTMLTANMGVELALRGKNVIAIDLDLGAANLHMFLGISPKYTIKDFLIKKMKLNEIIFDTYVKGFKIISGGGDLPGMANIYYWQKMHLIKQIKELVSDYIILDLSPGDSYNVIDFFLLADIPIIITANDLPSIANAYNFIRATIIRKLLRKFKNKQEICRLLNIFSDVDNVENIKTMSDIISMLNNELKIAIVKELNEFNAFLVINFAAENPLNLFNTINMLWQKYLNIKPRLLGFIFADNCVMDSIRACVPFVLDYPDSKPTQCIKNIIDKIAELI